MTALHELTTEQLSRRIDAATMYLELAHENLRKAMTHAASTLRREATDVDRYIENMSRANDAPGQFASDSDYARWTANSLVQLPSNLGILDIMREAGNLDAAKARLQTVLDEQQRRDSAADDLVEQMQESGERRYRESLLNDDADTASDVATITYTRDADEKTITVGDSVMVTFDSGADPTLCQIMAIGSDYRLEVIEIDSDERHWVSRSQAQRYPE
jgi:hypothetical protein